MLGNRCIKPWKPGAGWRVELRLRPAVRCRLITGMFNHPGTTSAHYAEGVLFTAVTSAQNQLEVTGLIKKPIGVDDACGAKCVARSLC